MDMKLKFLVNRIDGRQANYLTLHSLTLPLSGSGCIVSCPTEDEVCLDVFGSRLPGYFLYEYSRGGECRGLLCFDRFRGRILICNPTTKEWEFLPPSLTPENHQGAHLVASGIGYDESSEDFKIVRLCKIFDCEDVLGEIYSFKKNCWKAIPSPPRTVSPLTTVATYVNGYLCWPIPWKNTLISFNLATEEFSQSYLPGYDTTKFSTLSLFEHDGHLGYFVYDYPDPDYPLEHNKTIKIWLSKEGGSCEEGWSWELHHTIEEFDDVTRPLTLMHNLLFLEVKPGSDWMFWLRVYDLKTKKWENLDIRAYAERMEVFPYNPSAECLPENLRPIPEDSMNGSSVPHVDPSDSAPHDVNPSDMDPEEKKARID